MPERREAFEEGIADAHFLPGTTPNAQRMQAVLAQVHEAIAADVDDQGIDIDPALAACLHLALAGRTWRRRLSPPPSRR